MTAIISYRVLSSQSVDYFEMAIDEIGDRLVLMPLDDPSFFILVLRNDIFGLERAAVRYIRSRYDFPVHVKYDTTYQDQGMGV